MTLTTGLRRGLQALVPLLAVLGLMSVAAAPANAATVPNKYMQVFIPGSGASQLLNVSRARSLEIVTQTIVNAPIPVGRWVEVQGESYVFTGERLRVTLSLFENGRYVVYKQFFTDKVPDNDQKFFWIDTSRYADQRPRQDDSNRSAP